MHDGKTVPILTLIDEIPAGVFSDPCGSQVRSYEVIAALADVMLWRTENQRSRSSSCTFTSVFASRYFTITGV